MVFFRFRTRSAVSWSYHLDDVGVPNEIAVDPKGGDLVLFDADNERLGLVSGYNHEIMGAVRSVRQHDRLLRDAHPPAPPPAPHRQGHEGLLARLGVDEARMAALKDEGVLNWPDESYAAARRRVPHSRPMWVQEVTGRQA
jgi:hypothetical protein